MQYVVTNPRAEVENAAAYLREWLPADRRPDVFVQTGSGIDPAGLMDSVEAAMPLDELPGMPASGSPGGHALELLFGTCGSNRVLVACGRRHLYEGYGPLPCILPVCAAVLTGARSAVFLCAAGGIGRDVVPGTVMVATDYINCLGASPLLGAHPLGDTYFVDVTEAFSQSLISSFINTASEHGLFPRLGVYQANLGPQYETPAEVDVARRNGANAVGMSMVPETIAARALGCRVLGLALVTNWAARRSDAPLTHAEVVRTAEAITARLSPVLRAWLCSGPAVD